MSKNPYYGRCCGFSLHTILLILMLLLFMFSSCKSSKKSVDEGSRQEVTISSDKKGDKKFYKEIVKESESWLGTPYAYAHAEKGEGTDCSGMVMKVYETVAGIKIPRNSAKQAEYCKKIKKSDVKVGDLAFFATGKDTTKISHVGIMIDDETFIHASSSKGVIKSTINQTYYSKRFIMFGRIPR